MASLPRKPGSQFEDLLGRLHAEHVSEVDRLTGEITQLRHLVNLRPDSGDDESKEQPSHGSDDSGDDMESIPRLIRPKATPSLANRGGRGDPCAKSSLRQVSRLEVRESIISSDFKLGAMGNIAVADASNGHLETCDIVSRCDEESTAVISVGEVSPTPSPRTLEKMSPSMQRNIKARSRALEETKRLEEIAVQSQGVVSEAPPTATAADDQIQEAREQADKVGRMNLGTTGRVRTREELFQALRAQSNQNMDRVGSLKSDQKRLDRTLSNETAGVNAAKSDGQDSSVRFKVPKSRSSLSGISAPQRLVRISGDSDYDHRSSVFSSNLSSASADCFEFTLRTEWEDESSEEKRSTAYRQSQIHSSVMRRRSTKNLELLVAEDELLGCSKYVLHPSGQKRLCWDSMGMIMIGWDMVMIPMQAFEPEESGILLLMSWVTLLFWTFEIFISMCTGYIYHGVVILDIAKALKRYFRTWFVLDLLIVGIDWFFRMQNDGAKDSGKGARLLRSFRFLRFLRTIRLLRLLKLKKILQEIEDRINSEAVSIYFNVFKIVMFLLALNHIIACGWYAIGITYHNSGGTNWIQQNDLADEALIYRYATSLHWSLTQFTPASMEIRPFNVGERLFSIVVLLFALVAFSSFVSSLTSSMTHLRNIRTNETRQFWLLRRYLRDQNIPGELSRRIQRYLEYAYARRQNRVQESECVILKLLSERLRDELNHEAFVELIQVHPLFERMGPRNKLFFKATKMESLAKDDGVFNFGDQAKGMYCLQESMGLTEGLEYYIPGDDGAKERSMMISKPDWICEMSVWLECWMHMGDMTAVSECQIVQVDASKFAKAVLKSPIAVVTAKAYAQKFLETVNATSKSRLTDITSEMFRVDDLIPLMEHGGRRLSLTGGIHQHIQMLSSITTWHHTQKKEDKKVELCTVAEKPYNRQDSETGLSNVDERHSGVQ